MKKLFLLSLLSLELLTLNTANADFRNEGRPVIDWREPRDKSQIEMMKKQLDTQFDEQTKYEGEKELDSEISQESKES